MSQLGFPSLPEGTGDRAGRAIAARVSRRLARFAGDRSGAATVEWVMIAAVAVGLALASVLTVAQQASRAADQTAANMATAPDAARDIFQDGDPGDDQTAAAEDGGETSPSNGWATAPGGGTPSENRYSGDTTGGQAPADIIVTVAGSGGGATTSGGGSSGGTPGGNVDSDDAEGMSGAAE